MTIMLLSLLHPTPLTSFVFPVPVPVPCVKTLWKGSTRSIVSCTIIICRTSHLFCDAHNIMLFHPRSLDFFLSLRLALKFVIIRCIPTRSFVFVFSIPLYDFLVL